MRVLRLAVLLLVAGAVGAGVVGCSRTVAGKGTLAEGVTTTSPSPSRSSSRSSSPSPTDSPGPTPSPTGSSSPGSTPSTTADPVTVRRRTLCVLERASIASINSQFNEAKSRDAQISVLRTGSTSITGHLKRSGLPGSDRIYAYGKAVLSQLNNLVRIAQAGGSPSTAPYNTATTNFQKACSSF